MTQLSEQIREIDVVSFKEAVDQWPPGTRGTVVADYGDHKMVEISNDRGEGLDFPIVPVSNLKLEHKYS